MKITQLIAIVALGAVIIACNNQKTVQKELETKKDSTSYALGAVQTEGLLNQMKQLKAAQYINNKMLLKGVDDHMNGEAQIPVQQTSVILNSTIQRLRGDSTFTMPEASTGKELQNVADSFGYALGVQLVDGIKRGTSELKVEKDIDNSVVTIAITDVITDSSKMDQQSGRRLLNELMQKAKQKEKEINKEKYADNKKAGEEFLAKNKKRPEVKVTQSGLQYEVLEKGTGASPKATDKVKVHYHGTLIDGTVFDSSVERGEPVEFPLNRVIPGWTEGVQLMKEGAKYKFYIPQELAYGGADKGDIKPYSALIFEVELLEVMDK